MDKYFVNTDAMNLDTKGTSVHKLLSSPVGCQDIFASTTELIIPETEHVTYHGLHFVNTGEMKVDTEGIICQCIRQLTNSQTASSSLVPLGQLSANKLTESLLHLLSAIKTVVSKQVYGKPNKQ